MSLDNTYTIDGFDSAFIGFIERAGEPIVAVYDYNVCIQILLDQGLNEEEAGDYISYNITGAWLGKGTPAILVKCTLEDFKEILL